MCGFDPDLCVDLILGVCGFDPDLCVDLIPLPLGFLDLESEGIFLPRKPAVGLRLADIKSHALCFNYQDPPTTGALWKTY